MPKKKLTAAFVDKASTEKQTDYYDMSTSGLGLRVSPGGTKTFFYRYRYNGQNRRYSISRYSKKSFTLSDARVKVDELRSHVKKGGDPVGEEQQERRVKHLNSIKDRSFAELAKEFKEIHMQPLRKKTRDEHTRIIDNELIPALGKLPARQVDKSHIITLLDKKAIKDGKPTMANRIRARLHSIYEFGIHRTIVDKNPVTGIKRYSEGETKRERYYSKQEIRLLWKAFDEVNVPAGPVMKMLLLTGQRKTETMRMKWCDINGDVWTIPAELAKGKRSHDVPLSSVAIEIINTMRETNGGKNYIFSSPVLDDAPVKDLKRSVKKVRKYKVDDFTVSDFRLHDLRRTAATYMAKLNVDRTVLGKILNHKGLAGDGQVTAIYDRHTYMNEKRQALQKWAFHIERIITGEDAKISKIG